METLQIICFGGFGLAGVRFYDMFKHILALECDFTTGFCRFGVPRTFPPDQTNSEICVRGGGTMGGGATSIAEMEVTKTRFLLGLEAPEAWKPCK